MIQSTLKAHERKILDHRTGVPHITLALLRRSRGCDLLNLDEATHTTEIKRDIPLQGGGSMPIVFRVIDQLFWPVPSLLSYRQ